MIKMNEIVSLDQLVVEINFYSQQAATNMIEVGKRLIQAKEKVGHGEWGNWLKDNFNFTHRTATRFMQVANEFPNWTSMSNLEPTKIFALLDTPPEHREEVAAKADDMTVRQIQELNRKLKAQEQQSEQLKQSLQSANAKVQSVEQTKIENDRLWQENSRLLQQEPKIIEKVVEKEIVPRDYTKLKGDIGILENALQEISDQKHQLETNLKVMSQAQKDPYDYQKEFEAKASQVSGRVEQFIKDMAAFGYMGADYMKCTEYSQKRYEKAIERLDKLIRDLREQMNILAISSDKNIIEAEVIHHE